MNVFNVFDISEKKFYGFLLVFSFIFPYYTTIAQDSTSISKKQQIWLRQNSYDSLGLSQIQIAQLDSIDNNFSTRENLLIKNHRFGEEGLGKELHNLDKRWEKARMGVMTKMQYKEYRNRFKPIPTDPLKK